MKKILLVLFCIGALTPVTYSQVLYGATFRGGDFGAGAVIKFVPATNNLTVIKSLHSFPTNASESDLLQASDGKFYATADGGDLGYGVIYSFDPATSTLATVKTFDGADGRSPGYTLVQATDGKLYGVTKYGGNTNNGVIFSFDPSNLIYTKLYEFDNINGGYPVGSLVQAHDGKFYAMTAAGGSSNLGVIFSFDPISSTYTKLKDFDYVSGKNPVGSLIEGTDEKLYGMTPDGGNSSGGVIFSFDPSNHAYAKLKDLDIPIGSRPYGSLLQATDGKLYGVTARGGNGNRGVIFSIDPGNLVYTKLWDFTHNITTNPIGTLRQEADGKLYGMTSQNVFTSAGVIFSFDPIDSIYTVLHDFALNKKTPSGSLVKATDGKLYGIMANLIFSFDYKSSAFTVLKNINSNATGSNIPGTLSQAVDGKLYGTATNGGASGYGVIFSVDPVSSSFTTLINFEDSSGSFPTGNLLQASDGKLFGMTNSGGQFGDGVIFSYNPSTGIYTSLKDFDGADGSHPNGDLIQGKDGKLYGTTFYGGPNDYGVLFSFDPLSLVYTVLLVFDDTYFSYPSGSLLQATDGKLYGMTFQGGAFGYGTFYSFDPNTNGRMGLVDFDGNNGLFPSSQLIQATDGKIYGGMFEGGKPSVGFIFSFDPFTFTYKNVFQFDDVIGAYPSKAILQASDGKFYGMTTARGTNNFGSIYSYDPATSNYTNLQGFDLMNTGYPTSGSGFVELKSCTADTTYYQDADSDGYGNQNIKLQACTRPAGYVTDSTDCNDNNATVHPGAAEICGNGIDDNCDGQVDENCSVTQTISINNISVTEAQGFAKLTVSLSHETDKPVGILYYTKDGTATSGGSHKDYNAKIGLLFIPPGSLSATISIKIIKDDIDEPSEYFDVILFRALHASIADGTGRVTITDDGRWITHSETGAISNEQFTTRRFAVKVMPNPSGNTFQASIASNNTTAKAGMKVTDLQGRLIETRTDLLPDKVVRFGSNYRPGTYFLHIEQDGQKQTVEVIKLPE